MKVVPQMLRAHIKIPNGVIGIPKSTKDRKHNARRKMTKGQTTVYKI
jgi:hypothetical protein